MDTQLFELYKKEVGLSDFDSSPMTQAPISYQDWLEGRLIDGLRYQFNRWFHIDKDRPDFLDNVLVRRKSEVYDSRNPPKNEYEYDFATYCDSNNPPTLMPGYATRLKERFKGDPFWWGDGTSAIERFPEWLPVPK